MLDKPFKRQLDSIFKGSKFVPSKSRWGVVLRQRHVNLLGRSIDLNHLLSQRINSFVATNLEQIIQKFESGPVTAVIEIETLVNQVRLTHFLASQSLTLDPFEAIYASANDATSLTSFRSRIGDHAVLELVRDVFPNYCYNSTSQRFIRAPHVFTEEIRRDNPPKINANFLYGNRVINIPYAAVGDLTRGFFGAQHLMALLNLVGVSDFPIILESCLNVIHDKINFQIEPYVNILLQGLPGSTKLPSYDYGTAGCFGYFQLLLKDLLAYYLIFCDFF